MTLLRHCCAHPVPGADVMGPSDQRLEVAFSRATRDGLGITEFSGSLSPSPLSLLPHTVIEADEVNLDLQRQSKILCGFL